MKATRCRLLVIAGLLTGAALLSTAAPIQACVFYCWHVDATTNCCQTRTCEIVCG